MGLREKTLISFARRDGFEPLKQASLAGRKILFALFKKACKDHSDSKNLIATCKGMAKKSWEGFDYKDRQLLDDVLQKRLASLEDQIGEAADASEADQKEWLASLTDGLESTDMDDVDIESEKEELTDQKRVLVGYKESCFEPLKAGSWETRVPPKGLMTDLKKLFKLLDAAEFTNELGPTITGVFKKKASDRHGFDFVLVQQLEKEIDKRLASIDEQLGSLDTAANRKLRYTDVTKVEEALDVAKEALDEARENQREKLQEVMSTEKQRKRLELSLETKRHAISENAEKEVPEQTGDDDEQAAIEQVQKARDTLTFFRERAASAGTS